MLMRNATPKAVPARDVARDHQPDKRAVWPMRLQPRGSKQGWRGAAERAGDGGFEHGSLQPARRP